MNQTSTFRQLHNMVTPLILPNIWDVGSARLFESIGAKALATTSAGVCWALGYSDGSSLPIEWLIELTRRISATVKIPLSIDAEDGYSSDPCTVAMNVMAIADAGATGINIEDGAGDPNLLVSKLKAIRSHTDKRKTDLFINLRTDVYLQNLVKPEKAKKEAIRRALLYKEAGADGLFIPGLADPDTIQEIAKEVDMPINIMAWPGLPSAEKLGQLGVKRISAGSAIAQGVWQFATTLAKNYLETGDSDPIYKDAMPYADLQNLFNQK
jgi:2-methylisocitrate lyase-like PEP mutase family enzyme